MPTLAAAAAYTQTFPSSQTILHLWTLKQLNAAASPALPTHTQPPLPSFVLTVVSATRPSLGQVTCDSQIPLHCRVRTRFAFIQQGRLYTYHEVSAHSLVTTFKHNPDRPLIFYRHMSFLSEQRVAPTYNKVHAELGAHTRSQISSRHVFTVVQERHPLGIRRGTIYPGTHMIICGCASNQTAHARYVLST